MRLRSLALIAALALPGAALAQSWQDYDYPEAGFAVHFPAAPAVAKAGYTTSKGLSAPCVVYTVRQPDAVYTMTVADFSRASATSDDAISDAVKVATGAGEVRADVEARINRQYGRELSVRQKDGSISILAIFFFDKHLYVLHGQALAPDADGAAPKAVRFQQSLQFPER